MSLSVSVLEVDELVRAEVECLLAVGDPSGADDVGADFTCQLGDHRADCPGCAVGEDSLAGLEAAVLEQHARPRAPAPGPS